MTYNERVRVTPALQYGTGTASRNGIVVDARGYEGVAFLHHVHAAHDAGAASVKVQGGGASDGSDMADLTDVEMNLSTLDDGATKLIEVSHPRHRYLRVVAVKDDTNATAESCMACLYSGKSEPVTHSDFVDVLFKFAPEAAS